MNVPTTAIDYKVVFSGNFLLSVDETTFNDSLEAGATRVWAIMHRDTNVIWIVAAGPEQTEFAPDEHGMVLDGSVFEV